MRCFLMESLAWCYIQAVDDALTLRVSNLEKAAWRKAARAVGEDLSEFVRRAVRRRVQAVRSDQGSPWDDLLGSVSIAAPPATNRNVRKLMRFGRR